MSIAGVLLSLLIALGAAPASTHQAARVPEEHTGLLRPAIADLIDTVERGDTAGAERAASGLGPARLGRAASGDDLRAARAALVTLPSLTGGVLALADLTRAASSAVADVRRLATVAIGRLLADPIPLAAWDVEPDEIAAACHATVRVATSIEIETSSRLAALAALRDARGSCAAVSSSANVFSLTRDPDARIRRAAVLSAAGVQAASTEIRPLLADTDATVSAAAAMAMCVFDAHDADVRAAARRFTTASGVAAEDAAELAKCLRQ